MLVSEEFPFTLRGEPAVMRVLRNDGYCWGRLRWRGDVYDVMTNRDYYDAIDSVAADAFMRRARIGMLEPALGWAECEV